MSNPNLQSQYSAIPQLIARLTEVENLVGYKRSTIYALVKCRKFPPPIRLGPRRIAWLISDISAWIQSREMVGR